MSDFDKDPTSESVGCFSACHYLSLTGVFSSASSLNPLLHHWAYVLLNFTRFPLQKFEELRNLRDDPLNGMLLQWFFLVVETNRR